MKLPPDEWPSPREILEIRTGIFTEVWKYSEWFRLWGEMRILNEARLKALSRIV
jgi:hypothetical protein